MPGGYALDYDPYPTATSSGAPGNDYLHINASPEAFGARRAKGLEEIGQGAEQAGENQLSMDSQAHAAESHSWLSDQANAAQSAYTGLKGKAALDGLPTYHKDLEDKFQQAVDNAGNPATKQMVQTQGRQLLDRFKEIGTLHADRERDSYYKDTAVGGQRTSINNAQTYAQQGMWDAMDHQLWTAGQEVQNQYDPPTRGPLDEREQAEVDQRKKEIYGHGVYNIVDGFAAQGKFDLAEKVAQKYDGMIDADSRLRITKALEAHRAQREGNNIATDAITGAKDTHMAPGSVAGIPANFIAGIKQSEGFQARAAWDYKQFTNGYGTRAAHSAEIIDKATADQRFGDEITKAAKFVDGVNPNLDPGTRAAMTSLTYNGGGAWANGRLGQLIRAGDLDEAKKVFLSYTHAGGSVLQGLVDRRNREASWFGKENVEPSAAPQTVAYQPGEPQRGGQPNTPEQPSVLPAAIPAVNVAAAIKSNVFQRILDDPRSKENPAWRDAALTQAKRQLDAEEIAENQNTKVRKDANDTAAGKYTTAIGAMQYSSSPDWIGLDKAIIADPNLDFKTKHELRGWVAQQSGGQADHTFGAGFWDAYQAVHAPDGDPGKITDVNQLYPMVGPGKPLTIHGLDKLRTEIEGSKTPYGQAEAAMKKDFLEKVARPQIAYSDPELKIYDAKGEARFLGFQAAFFDALQEGRKKGLTTFQMLSPESKDYIGGLIDRFKPSAGESVADRINDKAAPPPTNWFKRQFDAVIHPLGPEYREPPKPFDAASVKSLADLTAAFHAGQISSADARKMAIEKKWGRIYGPPPGVPSTP